MKRMLMTVSIWLVCSLIDAARCEAQLPIIEIIKEGITKVIVAVDLKVQRLQNKTIWLQNAQKFLENTGTKIHLDQINEWVQKQKDLYSDYFNELRNVKNSLLYYKRVKDIIEQQLRIVNEYKTAWALFRQDKNFTPDELTHILNVFTGMIDESAKNIDQLSLVITAFVTQMSDAKRLAVIDDVAENVQQTLTDLRQFNRENKMISLQRSVERNDIEYVKKLYGF